MAKIEKFEVIEARQKARALLKAIYFVAGDGAFVRAAGHPRRRAGMAEFVRRALPWFGNKSVQEGA